MRFLLAVAALIGAATSGWSQCPDGKCPLQSGSVFSPAPRYSVAAAPKELPWWTGRVNVDLGGGRGQGGTGTPIHTEDGRTLILTNAHVVPRNLSSNPMSVEIKGIKYPARYVEGSDVAVIGPSLIDIQGPDLCVLVVDAELQSVDIAKEPPAIGVAVRQWGYGGTQPGQLPVLRGGPVRSPQFDGEAFQVGYQPISGDSGAGVFDANGRLCAVCTGSSGANGRVVSVVTVRSFVVRPVVHRLFPRLADRLAAQRLTPVAPKAVAAPPPAKK